MDALGLAQADDRDVWTYAQDYGFTIVTKDSDFNELLILKGFPPKVIWIRRGNCSTTAIETILRSHLTDIQTLAQGPNLGILDLH